VKRRWKLRGEDGNCVDLDLNLDVVAAKREGKTKGSLSVDVT
jgi:hypothetical protein